MRSIVRSCVFISALAATFATPALAQGPLSTGSFVNGRDQNWEFAVGNGAYSAAWQVSNNPGWNDFAGPTSARWISFAASASSPAATPYHFRTSFNLTGFNPLTASLNYTCGVDNSLVSVLLNGSAVNNVSCPFHNLGTTQTLSNGFNGGMNTLEFVVSGDGVTDGFIFNTESFSARAATTTTPEPSTFVLLIAGFGAVGVAARRRRNQQ